MKHRGFEIDFTRCPVARAEAVELSELVEVGGERRRERFTREIHWLRQSESAVSAWHGSAQLVAWSTFNDWYGFLTSAERSAPEEARSKCRYYCVGASSTLEIRIITRIFEAPRLAPPEDYVETLYTAERGWGVWAHVPGSWAQGKPEIETYDGESVEIWPRLGEVELATETTWCSRWKDPDRQAGETVERLREAYGVAP